MKSIVRKMAGVEQGRHAEQKIRRTFLLDLASELSRLKVSGKSEKWAATLQDGAIGKLVETGEGYTIWCEWGYPAGRMEVHGGYPYNEATGREHGLRYGEQHNIGFNTGKGAVKCARDIAARFLPQYFLYWERGLAARDQENWDILIVQTCADKLKKSWGEGKVLWSKGLPAEARFATPERGSVTIKRLGMEPDRHTCYFLSLPSVTEHQAHLIGKVLSGEYAEGLEFLDRLYQIRNKLRELKPETEAGDLLWQILADMQNGKEIDDYGD